jgi:acyl-[acyl-carrier-protein]-phospholipid O-acyltransferase/long-chain-fatty-acid--[acyl-carrier-protein] ligase
VVNLDYSVSGKELCTAIEVSDIEQIYTTARFLKRVEAKGLESGAIPESIEIVDIEVLNSSISRSERIATFVYTGMTPATLLKRLSLEKCRIDDIATINFRKYETGEYRGVMLTHRNLMANTAQLFDLLNVREEDVMLTALPLYQTMGLTAGILLPMIYGIPMACHPDSSNARGVGRTAARYGASIFFGNPELFHLYTRSRQLHPLMFASLRLVFSSQERLAPSVKRAFEERFKQRIYEGYCLAESTAVASLNLPDILETNEFTVQIGNKAGSVGMPLPGTLFRIVDPETMVPLQHDREGLILVGGAQVMLGYLNNPERTRSAVIEMDGLRWVRSEEKGYLDEEGFLFLAEDMREE